MLISKSVLRRKKNAFHVMAAIATHGKRVAEMLDAAFSVVHDPELPERPYAPVLGDLWRFLNHARLALEKADWAHNEEVKINRRLRRARDLTVRVLHAKLSDVSTAVDSTFGALTAEETLGLGRGLVAVPDQTLELARAALATLRKPGFEMPSANLEGVDLSASAIEAQLAGPVEQLEKSMKALRAEKTLFDRTLKEKLEAIDAFDNVYSQTARIAKGYFLLAGEKMLAKRILPTVRRLPAAEPPAEDDEAVEVDPEEEPEEPEGL